MLNINKFVILTLFLAVFCLNVADANSTPKTLRTDIIKQNFESRAPLSSATLKFMYVVKVYDLHVWTDFDIWSYDNKFALQAVYARGFKGGDIAQRSVGEIMNYHDLSEAEQNEYLNIFRDILPNVKKNDLLTAIYNDDKTVDIYHNSKKVGSIEDKKIAKRFLDIWFHKDNEYENVSCALRGDCG